MPTNYGFAGTLESGATSELLCYDEVGAEMDPWVGPGNYFNMYHTPHFGGGYTMFPPINLGTHCKLR